MQHLHRSHTQIFRRIALATLIIGLIGLAFLLPSPATSAESSAVTASSSNFSTVTERTEMDAVPHAQTDLSCRLCHGDSESELEFPSGETLLVQVDLDGLVQSAHGSQAESPLTCTACHQPPDNYHVPHAPVETADLRSYEIERSSLCQRCHIEPHMTSHPGLESENPVVCTDCHGSHDVLTVDQWQAGEGINTCVDCHTAVGVERADEAELTGIIQGGLFAKQTDNEYCLACHSQPDWIYTFENGETLSLTIDEEALHNSVHGADNSWQPLDCVNCHEGYKYPHEPITAASLREYNLEKYTACANCHEKKYTEAEDSVHGDALAEGMVEAAVCTDCHGAHDTPVPDEPRERISHTCQQCHSTIFEEYADSVHGEALLSESNPDVPTCIECHGVHNIGDPTTALFRVRSPELCATCHADEELMNKYDISTEVFNTYVADFHGTTVTLFEHQDPTVETNKAVCYDCHGVHNIKPPDDPEAGIKTNLLETCQQCHPNATANFSDSWTSHFRPSLEHNPLVYLVNLFYQIVIPLTVGFFAFMVATDIYRRVRMRLKS